MRKALFCVLMMLPLLCACGAPREKTAMDAALEARSAYRAAAGLRARADVTADYGRRVYTYTLGVSLTGGETALTVLAPAELFGMTARLNGEDGRLEYDGAVLETGPLPASELTPLGAVDALWQAALDGFPDSGTFETVDDRPALRLLCREPALEPGKGQEVTLWLDPDSYALLRGEIALDGRRVIDCVFTEFTLQ